MARYWRFRKKEGRCPNFGPYAVIRKEREVQDYFTNKLHAQPLIDLSIHVGFYVANYTHIKVTWRFLYKEIFWEVF
jgi:hypothetical protein